MVSEVAEILFSDETLFTYIGYAAGLATIIAFAIQTFRILRTKNITGLSSYMFTMYSLALICWFAYGVFIDSWILAISNLITFFFTFSILLLILYYDEEDKIERYRRDPLTYVFNKKYFEETVPVKMVESLIAGKPFAIIMGSINNLDTIQQNFGGKYKDRTLKLTAKALEKALRDSDFIARVDNNKFAIFLSEADEKIAKNVCTRVIESIHNVEVKKSAKQIMHPEMLLGVCPSKYSSDLSELSAFADEALAQASYKGRNMLKIYKPEKK